MNKFDDGRTFGQAPRALRTFAGEEGRRPERKEGRKNRRTGMNRRGGGRKTPLINISLYRTIHCNAAGVAGGRAGGGDDVKEKLAKTARCFLSFLTSPRLLQHLPYYLLAFFFFLPPSPFFSTASFYLFLRILFMPGGGWTGGLWLCLPFALVFVPSTPCCPSLPPPPHPHTSLPFPQVFA